MPICKLLCCCGLIAGALVVAREGVAQDRDVTVDERQSLVVSGFAVICTLRSASLLPRPSYCGGA